MIKKLRLGFTNCYIISGDGQSILVDTGTKRFRYSLYQRVKDYNIGLIVLTHGHVDHIENANWLAQKLQVPLAIHRADYNTRRANDASRLKAHTLIGRIMRAGIRSSMGKTKLAQVKAAVWLHEGQSLAEYGVDAQIIELPGHSPGSIGVIVGGKEIIVGDAMMRFGKTMPAPIYEDRRKMYQSVQKIKHLKLQRIHVSHI